MGYKCPIGILRHGGVIHERKEEETERPFKKHLSKKFVDFFVHSSVTKFSRSIGALQSTPMSPPRVEPNWERLRTDLTLFFLRTIRI